MKERPQEELSKNRAYYVWLAFILWQPMYSIGVTLQITGCDLVLLWGVGNILEDGYGANQRYPRLPGSRIGRSDGQRSGAVDRPENILTMPRDGEKEEGQGTVLVTAV